MEIDKITLENIIKNAEITLYENDSYLINNYPEEATYNSKEYSHVGERAIVFRFGHYLDLLFSEFINQNTEIQNLKNHYSIDVEYNRNGLKPKHLAGIGNVYPDLIIHHRGDNEDNLLVIEFKGWWQLRNQDLNSLNTTGNLPNKTTINQDITKILAFIKNEEYNYKFGLFILITKKGFVYEWKNINDICNRT